MRLSTSWLLPALMTAASAASDASVYLFQADSLPRSSNPPTLSPEQARLVIAQRLGASRYHILVDDSAATLSYINKFGGQRAALFEEPDSNKPAELVLIVDGVSAQIEEPLLKAWSSSKPAFAVSSPPSATTNSKLVKDLAKQIREEKACAIEDDINPFEEDCWIGKSKIVYYDLSEPSNTVAKLVAAQKRMMNFVNQEALNVLVVLMPKSSAKTGPSSYGTYEMPSQSRLDRRQVEEPMNGAPVLNPATPNRAPSTPLKTDPKPITGVPPVCYSSLDACNERTNNCSGHGECYKKRASAEDNACFSCACKVQQEKFVHGSERKAGIRLTYWGGAACQKEDVSGPFWLISIFTVVMVGVVSWAIGLMYSIGEEKLPGVIGAGVSTNRGAR